jgi:hypothetical protein
MAEFETVKLYTLVTFKPGAVPEVTLSGRPFEDCHSVGCNFLTNSVISILGSYQNVLVRREEKREIESHAVTGREFVIFHDTAFLLSSDVKLGTYYIVED